MSGKKKSGMAEQLINNKIKSKVDYLCVLSVTENKSNCVILFVWSYVMFKMCKKYK